MLFIIINKKQIQMKLLSILLFFLIQTFNCFAQESKLLTLDPITDISESPIYKKLTKTVNDSILWKDKYKYIDNIEMNWMTYLSDGLKISGLLVKPKKPGKYPCIIYNRGGSGNFGQLSFFHSTIILGDLASKGYIVIASNYRGNGKSEGREEFGGSDVNDVINLIDILKEIEEADIEKIGMYGWSRGGMMTYLALTQTDQIDVACVGGANADLTQIDRPNMESGVYAQYIPNYTTNKQVELEKRSAIFWVDKFPKNVPILLLHGNADWRVKSKNSLKLALEFEKYRIPYRLKIFDGADHGIKEYRNEVNKEVVNWFDRFLKHNEPIPNMEYHGK